MGLRIECQNDLSASIKKLNPKSKLHVIREAPQTVLPKLFKAWKVSHLVFEKDTDGYARLRDEEVKKLAKAAGVQVVTVYGRTLYDPDELVKKNGGKPTMSISQVQHVRLASSILFWGGSQSSSSNANHCVSLEKRLGISQGRFLLPRNCQILAKLRLISRRSSRRRIQTTTPYSEMEKTDRTRSWRDRTETLQSQLWQNWA